MEKMLSIIIPAYNEEAHIGGILRKVANVVLPYGISKQLIVVNDGSKDGTAEEVRRFSEAHPEVDLVLLEHETNHGKGRGIRTGLERVKGDLVVIQDGDEELDPEDFVPMVKLMVDEGLPVVYGSRFLGKEKHYAYRSFYFGARVLSALTNILYRQHITDEATCYKMFRTEVIRSITLRCEGFEFCPEVTAKVGRKGIRIKEVPIHYNPRTIEQGKKVRARDGLKAMWVLLKYRIVK